jgi:hypothetical protein
MSRSRASVARSIALMARTLIGCAGESAVRWTTTIEVATLLLL